MSLKTLWGKLGNFISSRSTFVLVAALFLILPSLIGAALIEMKTGVETIVSEDSKVYQDYEAYSRTFLDTGSIVVFITTNNALDFDVLSAMSRLEDTLSRIEGVTQVTSLAGIIKAAVKERTGQAYIPHNEAEIRQTVDSLPQGLRQGLMPDEQHAIMSVEMPATLAFERGEELLRQTEGVLDWVDFPPDVDIIVTGDIAFYTQMEEEMNSGLRVMLLSAAILMVLILWLVFRHVRKRLLPLAVVMIGVIWTFRRYGLPQRIPDHGFHGGFPPPNRRRH